jgi:hypothetical protein
MASHQALGAPEALEPVRRPLSVPYTGCCGGRAMLAGPEYRARRSPGRSRTRAAACATHKRRRTRKKGQAIPTAGSRRSRVIRAHQPGSEPIDIPETIPNPVVVPKPTPTSPRRCRVRAPSRSAASGYYNNRVSRPPGFHAGIARHAGSASRSPSHIEPVSGVPERKLENGGQSASRHARPKTWSKA